MFNRTNKLYKPDFTTSIIIALSIFSVEIFFSLLNIFRSQYVGSENSQVYIIYLSVIVISSVLLSLHGLINSRVKLTKITVILLILPLVLIVMFSLDVIRGDYSNKALQYLIYQLTWMIPPIYIVIYMRYCNLYKIANIFSIFEILMLIFTASSILTTMDNIFFGNLYSGVGGETYQTASYIAALAFGLNLHFLLNGKYHIRYKVTLTNWYKLLCLILLPVQVVSVIVSGGRGGFVLLVAYILLYIFSIRVKKINTRSIIVLFVIFIITLVLIILLNSLNNVESFKIASQRVFSFISSEGILWKNSGRMVEYSNAMALIMKSPLFGYGFYGIWKISGYPHNIILEILLQGGLFYLLLSSIIFIYTLFRYLKVRKKYKYFKLVDVISIYSLVILSFTSTYTINSKFWFFIAWIVLFSVIPSREKYEKKVFIR